MPATKGFNPVRGAWGDNTGGVAASAGARGMSGIGGKQGKMTATPFIGHHQQP
jgi:hypothetical protein